MATKRDWHHQVEHERSLSYEFDFDFLYSFDCNHSLVPANEVYRNQ